jgi:hypothetical protein
MPTDVLLDELQLRRLAERYGVAVDDGDHVTLSRLFVPGGTLIVYRAGIEEPLYSFREGEFEQLTDGLAKAYRRTFHLISNVVADVDGDVASGVVYCLASHLRAHARGDQVAAIPVRYDDRYARTPAGWRFTERRAILLWEERRPADQRPPPD